MTDTHLNHLKLALGEAYTIERELVGGGMSRVFVATEHALGREVVIKVLPQELAAGVNRERFRREVQLAARLSHPYIVPLLHAGERGELLWFTMPFISGESLRTRLERSGPLSVPETLRLLHDTVEALAYAHSRGVIHRDIKPGNILSDGQHAMVTDFGVAKALSASMPMGPIAGHTTSGMAIGTPAYMAPEQLAADPSANHRVDIYAVGLLGYELLTGKSPFAAASPTATMTAQLTRTPDLLHLSRPDVPPALSQLVRHCLAKDAEDRPVDAQAVLSELDRISGAIAADTHRSASDAAGTGAGRRAFSLPLMVASAATIALVIGGVWYAQRGTGAPSPAPRVDTVTVLTGRDSGDRGVPLQAPAQRPLTHADSLRIAQALRDELEQMDPTFTSRPTAIAIPGGEVSLERQLAMTDSLVRVRIAEFTPSRRIPRPDSAQSISRIVTGPASGTGLATEGAPRRVLVVTSRQRGTVDSAITVLNQAATREFARQLGAAGGWDVVIPERTQGVRDNELSGAEALVSVGISHSQTSADSMYLRIGVRNLMPGSTFGYRVVTSPAVVKPTTLDPFRSVMDEALGLLKNLRGLPTGATWQLDMGRSRPPDIRRPE